MVSDYIIRIRGILEKKNRAREESHRVGKIILKKDLVILPRPYM